MRKRNFIKILPFIFCITLFAGFFGGVLVNERQKTEPIKLFSAETGFDYNGNASRGNRALLSTVSYAINNDSGYNVKSGEVKQLLPNKMAGIYLEAFGEGGEIIKGNSTVNGFQSYGYVVGSGEDIRTDKQKQEALENDIEGDAGSKLDNEIMTYVGLRLKYNYDSMYDILGSAGYHYSVTEDSWKGTVDGVSVGVVKRGALIVRKSLTGQDGSWVWENPLNDKDMKGFHTVDIMQEYVMDIYSDEYLTIYTPDGAEMNKGIYIKVTFAYELSWDLNELDSRKSYKNIRYENVVEETVIYLTNTSAEVIFENMYFNSGSQDNNDNDNENLYDTDGDGIISQSERLNKAGEISNEQGSAQGFRIDMKGANYTIQYRHNNEQAVHDALDNDTFEIPGRYDFTITTGIGVTRNKTIFIHEPSAAKNREYYFGDGFIQGDSTRVFDTTSNYPVYVAGQTYYSTEEIDNNHTELVGRVGIYVKNKPSGIEGVDYFEKIERNINGTTYTTYYRIVALMNARRTVWSGNFTDVGDYLAEFANNKNYFDGAASGDTYRFEFRFKVIENGLKPAVNQELINYQLGFSDYSARYYAVAIPSKGVGNAVYAFQTESDASQFAYKYLLTLVTKSGNIYIFDGQTYTTQSSAIAAVIKEANLMPHVRYFDASNPDSYVSIASEIVLPIEPTPPVQESELQKYSDAKSVTTIYTQEQIDEMADGFTKEWAQYYYDLNYYETHKLTNRNLPQDIIVFAVDATAYNSAIGEPFLNSRVYRYINDNNQVVIYDEQGYITSNSVAFVQVDEFETNSGITLIHEASGKQYKINYGVVVGDFLDVANAPTGRYKIVEENKNGTSAYYAIYIRSGENTTKLNIERVYNGAVTTALWDRYDFANYKIPANAFTIKSATNDLDPYGIVKITERKRGLITIMQLDEVNNYIIDEVGNYTITAVDRLGNAVNYYVDISIANKMYTFTLVNGTHTILTESAFNGKEFVLEPPRNTYENFEFIGWADENGNIYNGVFCFDTPYDLTLNAVWNYKETSVIILGKDIQTITTKPNAFVELPDIQGVIGLTVYGYMYNAESNIIFYRGQINSVPNVADMQLVATWVDYNDGIISNGSPLPGRTKEGLVFIGWVSQQSVLSGVIYNAGVQPPTDLGLYPIYKDNSGDLQTSAAAGTTVFGGSIVNTIKVILPFITGVLLLLMVVYCVIKLLGLLERKMKTTTVTIDTVVISKRQKARLKYNLYLRYVLPVIILLLSVVMLGNFIGRDAVELKITLDTREQQEQAIADIRKILDTESAVSPAKQDYIVPDILKLELQSGDDEEQETGELTDEEIMLYSRVYADAVALGYDIFPAVTDNGIRGFAYTKAETVYANDTDGNLVIGCGFASLQGEPILTDTEVDNGILVGEVTENSEITYDYIIAYQEEWSSHYVAYLQYVKYSVANFTIDYCPVADDPSQYDEGLGQIYDYDINQVVFEPNLGNLTFDASTYSITDEIDYDYIVEMYRSFLQEQDTNSVNIELSKIEIISRQAILDELAGEQKETFMGLTADEVYYYEMAVGTSSYYYVDANGDLQVLSMPIDPERKASWQERFWTAVLAVALVATAIVICVATVGTGSVLGAMIIAAAVSVAVDLFMDVTISGTPLSEVNVTRIIVDAVISAALAGFGAYLTGAKWAYSGQKGYKAAKAAKAVKELGWAMNALLNGAEAGIAQGIMTGIEGGSFVECMRNMLIGVGVGFGISAFATFFVNLSSKLFRALGKKINALFNKADNITSALDNKLDDIAKKIDPPAHTKLGVDLPNNIKLENTVNANTAGKLNQFSNQADLFYKNGDEIIPITKADLLKHADDLKYMDNVIGDFKGTEFKIIDGTPYYTNGSVASLSIGDVDDIMERVPVRNGVVDKNALRQSIVFPEADDKLAKQIGELIDKKQLDLIPKQIADYCKGQNINVGSIDKDIIRSFREAQKYQWHELIVDGQYVTQLVSGDIHAPFFKHYGGADDIAREMLERLKGIVA